VFTISAAAYTVSEHLSPRLFRSSVFVWLAVAVIQVLYDKGYGTWLLPRVSTSPLRGVTALAVEPSSSAVMGIFFLLFNELFHADGLYRWRSYILVLLAAMCQMVVSVSGMGLLLLSVFLVAKSMAIVTVRRRDAICSAVLSAGLTYGLLIALVWLFLNASGLSATRAGRLLGDFFDDPVSVLGDQSVEDRLTHIVVPFSAFVSGGWAGFGLATWRDHGRYLASETGGRFGSLSPYASFGDRVLSGWGSAVFELGVFGLVMIGAVSAVFLGGAARDKDRRPVCLVCLLVVHVVMMSAVPVALPAFPLLVGLCARRTAAAGALHPRTREPAGRSSHAAST
jgi:hypothetical protein